jgi:hypothetical protein
VKKKKLSVGNKTEAYCWRLLSVILNRQPNMN